MGSNVPRKQLNEYFNLLLPTRGGSSLGVWGGPHGRNMGAGKFYVATPFRLSENVGNALFASS